MQVVSSSDATLGSERMRPQHLLLGGVACLLEGCSALQTKPQLHKALSSLERDLSKTGAVDTSDLLSGNGHRRAQAKRYIKTRQCQANKADPLFLVPNKLTLTLNGTFTRKGDFTLTYPKFKLGQSASDTSGSALKISMTLVSLSGLAQMDLQDQLKKIAALDTTKALSHDRTKALQAEAFLRYKKLSQEINNLETRFDPATCPHPKVIHKSVGE